MEMLSSAVITELVNRSVSFLFAKCKNQITTAATMQEEDLQLLRRLLMRSDTIVEEAERRHVTDPDMLRQLKALRDKTHTAHHVLDTVRCRALPASARGEGSRANEGEEEKEVNRHAFELSKFNPAKRVRPSGDLESTVKLKSYGAGASSKESLHQMVCSLERMISGMDEFVVLLMSCPPLYRVHDARIFHPGVHEC